MNQQEPRTATTPGGGVEVKAPLSAAVRVAALFAVAVQRHRAGRLAEAESRYRQVLDIDPGHAESLHLLGVVAHQAGRSDVAVELIGRAIALNNRNPAFLNNQGLSLQTQGKLAEAIKSYWQALALKPNYAEAYFNLGIALTAQGKLDEAVESYRRALDHKPDYPEAHNNLGNALKDQGKLAEAVESFGRALAIRPAYAEAHNNLGNILRDQGKLAEAAESYERALALKPDYPEAHNNLGNALRDQSKPAEAVESYGRALALKPDYAEAHNNLGNALKDQRKLDEAVESYRRALALKPDYAEAHNNLGTVLLAQGKLAEAVESYRHALAVRPDFADACNNMGAALQDLGRFDEAMESYERALVLKPDSAEAHGYFGTALLALGRIEEARQRFETAVKLAPRHPYFHSLLGESKKFTADDPQLADLRTLARDAASFSEEHQIELHFALGKAYDDIGAREDSFRHLLLGNALKRRRIVYDERATFEQFERIRRSFPSAAMRSGQGSGDPSPVPTFIVGMPRSGSTLIEQILASHPGVHGAGELDDFSNELAKTDPKAILNGAPSRDALRALGTRYVSALRVRAPNAVRITDKMLGNFRYAGLIHLALPNARIIHSRRDPIDTCLSCFSKFFHKGSVPFSYDLAELGRQYRAYERMMEHWRSVLPEGVMLEVDYEALVDDLEGQARRIVAHCGLDWDDACLSFHKTQRPVSTASALQVRQPIYRSSVGKWRPDAELLRPLTDALAEGRDA